MSFGFNRVRRPARAIRADNAGITSMEVAITFGLFLVLMLGVIDLARFVITKHALSVVAATAARRGIVDPTFQPCGGPPPDTFVMPSPLLDPQQLTLCVSQPFFALGVQEMTVTASYHFAPITPGLESLLGDLTENLTYQY